MLNGTNTLSVITSCSILSCGSVSLPKPMRLAGTCSRYSKNAIPQLARIGDDAAVCSPRFLRWPYQANVMKMFEPTEQENGGDDRIHGATSWDAGNEFEVEE